MTEIIIVFVITIVFASTGYNIGRAQSNHDAQKKCEDFYSDMPHNKVTEHCKTILKFGEIK